jgi:hypothetical protein
VVGAARRATGMDISTDDLLELAAVIGAGTMFSGLLRTLEVPLEDGVAPWPPDGRSPRP